MDEVHEAQSVRRSDVLIRSAWFEGEARELGIVVTAKQVRERLRAEGGDTPTGLTRQDLVEYTRALLAARGDPGADPDGGGAERHASEQIDAYVQAHPRTDPEQRTLRRSSRPTSERNARRAMAALKRGATWRTVAKRYSIDTASVRKGGLQPPVARDLLSARLGRIVFTAKQGQLLGPIKAPDGHLVLKVVAIEPEHPTPLETQRAAAWEVARERGAAERAHRLRNSAHRQVAPAHDLRAGSRRPPRLRQHLNRRRSRNRLTQRPGPKTRTSAELPRPPLSGVSGRPMFDGRTTFAEGSEPPAPDSRSE